MTTTKEKIYVSFDKSELTVYEGDRKLTITVNRSKIPSTPVLMSAEIHPASGGTAKRSRDFLYDTANPPKVTWPADDTSLQKSVDIPIQQNDISQGDRTLILHFSKPINCAKGAQLECRITIKDGINPQAPIPTPFSPTYTVGADSGEKTLDQFLDAGRTQGLAAGDSVKFVQAIAPTTFYTAVKTASAPIPIPAPTADDAYSQLVLADQPLLYCKYGSVSKPIDLSGNNKDLQFFGTVSTTVENGYTFDNTGNAGIVLNEILPIPAICTVELGFKGTSGGLFYFGDGKTGSQSFSLDFLISGNTIASWIAAKVGGKWMTMGSAVNDGNWHKFTLISGANSFVIILDGANVHSEDALPSTDFSGFWHFGVSMVGQSLIGSIKNFSVSNQEISVDRAIQRQTAMSL